MAVDEATLDVDLNDALALFCGWRVSWTIKPPGCAPIELAGVLRRERDGAADTFGLVRDDGAVHQFWLAEARDDVVLALPGRACPWRIGWATENVRFSLELASRERQP